VGKGGKRFSRLRVVLRFSSVIVMASLAGLLPAAAFPTLAVDPAPPVPNPPLVGFSFSPRAVIDGRAPEAALAELLKKLQPDLVRLPVYWASVAPTSSTLDYSETDRLLNVVRAHNKTKGVRQAQVVLVVGARNLVYPEVHLPSWLGEGEAHKLETLLRTTSYRQYLETTFKRYADLSMLRAWQVENEPLDPATSDQVKDGALPEELVRSEVDLLRSIDLAHEVVITTFNSAHVEQDLEGASPLSWFYAHLPGAKAVGHPKQVLTMGDTLGLDLYVVTETTPLEVISASTRIAWKEDALDFWQNQAQKHGRGLWITEMQASPWIGTSGFTVSDLWSSALAYRGHGVTAYLLWGVENWLDSPEWMSGGMTAIKLLRESR
jgi:hypothetical protein